MLLYEYPPKLDRQGRQLKAAHDIEERRKMQKTMYRNLLLGLIIIMLGLFIKVMLIKIIVVMIGAVNIAVACLLYRYSAMYRDTRCYTRIYDDRLEHCQTGMLSGKTVTVALMYEDIVRSQQTPSGSMTFFLKEGIDSEISCEGRNTSVQKELEQGKITLFFQDTKAKLYLIENLHDKIKYPKKEYNIIDDDPDEDDLWNPLHKHGL